MNVGTGRRGLLTRASLARAQRSVVGAGWVVGDQALISASNFLGMVIAARAMPTADFGTYALAWTGIWALNSVQSSLITQPYSVLAARSDEAAYRGYTTATGRMQVVMTLAVSVPIVAVGLVAVGVGVGPVLVAVGLAVMGWQAQEFMRRVLFFEGRFRAVGALDVVSFGGQLAAIAVLAVAGQLTVASALVAAAVTSAISALIGLRLLRSTFAAEPLAGTAAENVAHGRWLLGAEVGAFICLNSYPFILALTTGSEAVAIYAAAMLILNPLNVIWFAVGNVLPIRLSRARASRGDGAARGELRAAYRGSMPVVGLYCLVAALLSGPLLAFLFGDAYAGYGWVVAGAALIRFVGYHSHLLAIGLRAQHNTRPIFTGYVIAAPFSVVIGVVLTSLFGIAGALVAMLAATLVWTAAWARAYARGPDDAGRAWPEDEAPWSRPPEDTEGWSGPVEDTSRLAATARSLN
ncbi:MAG: lipopolysaccharide biosynthesis protein [Chloroflexota bacterium]